MSSAPVATLHALLGSYLSGGIDTAQFCDAFERSYNFEVDKTDFNRIEAEAFAELFDEVVFYSPFPDERAMILNYRSEVEIKQAAERAAAKLAP